MHRAVFLDRDGTINEEVGYLHHVEQLSLYPWAADGIRKLNRAGLRVVVVTNQSGVARGHFPEELVGKVHARLVCDLERAGAHLDGIYYCPHHPEGIVAPYRQDCRCRKPAPEMLERAAADLDLDLHSSFVIGDKYLDVETAHRVGARGILLLSGYGREEYENRRDSWPRMPDHVAPDLSAAADWIIERTSS